MAYARGLAQAVPKVVTICARLSGSRVHELCPPSRSAARFSRARGILQPRRGDAMGRARRGFPSGEAERCSSARKPSRRHWHAISNDARRFGPPAAYVRPPQGRPNLAVFGPLFFVGLVHLKARCGQKSSCDLAAQKAYGLASWKLIVRA